MIFFLFFSIHTLGHFCKFLSLQQPDPRSWKSIILCSLSIFSVSSAKNMFYFGKASQHFVVARFMDYPHRRIRIGRTVNISSVPQRTNNGGKVVLFLFGGGGGDHAKSFYVVVFICEDRWPGRWPSPRAGLPQRGCWGPTENLLRPFHLSGCGAPGPYKDSNRIASNKS